MFKNFFNQMFSSRSSTSSKPVCETQGFATTTHADLNNDVVELYLRFLSPDEIAKIKRVSWGYYERANQVLNHYRLIDKDCQEKVGLKFLKLELSYRQNFLLVQNSQGQKQVYAWGANKVGQLGLGHDNDVNRPSLLPFPDSLANWTLNSIVSNGVNTFAIFQNQGQKQMYAWGYNPSGELGLGHNNSVQTPTLIPFFKGATGPGQLPLQRKKILNSLSSSSAVTSSTSSAPLTASSSSSHVRVPSLPGTLTSLNAQAPRPEGHKRQAGDSPEREISSATANAKKIRSSFLLESSSSSSSSSSSNPELANSLSQIKAEWGKQSANLVQSTSSSPNTPRVNSYLSSQSGLSQTESSSQIAEPEQKPSSNSSSRNNSQKPG